MKKNNSKRTHKILMPRTWVQKPNESKNPNENLETNKQHTYKVEL